MDNTRTDEAKAFFNDAFVGKEKKITRLSMAIPNELHKAIKQIALDTGKPMHQIVVKFLQESLLRHKDSRNM